MGARSLKDILSIWSKSVAHVLRLSNLTSSDHNDDERAISRDILQCLRKPNELCIAHACKIVRSISNSMLESRLLVEFFIQFSEKLVGFKHAEDGNSWSRLPLSDELAAILSVAVLKVVAQPINAAKKNLVAQSIAVALEWASSSGAAAQAVVTKLGIDLLEIVGSAEPHTIRKQAQIILFAANAKSSVVAATVSSSMQHAAACAAAVARMVGRCDMDEQDQQALHTTLVAVRLASHQRPAALIQPVLTASSVLAASERHESACEARNHTDWLPAPGTTMTPGSTNSRTRDLQHLLVVDELLQWLVDTPSADSAAVVHRMLATLAARIVGLQQQVELDPTSGLQPSGKTDAQTRSRSSTAREVLLACLTSLKPCMHKWAQMHQQAYHDKEDDDTSLPSPAELEAISSFELIASSLGIVFDAACAGLVCPQQVWTQTQLVRLSCIASEVLDCIDGMRVPFVDPERLQPAAKSLLAAMQFQPALLFIEGRSSSETRGGVGSEKYIGINELISRDSGLASRKGMPSKQYQAMKNIVSRCLGLEVISMLDVARVASHLLSPSTETNNPGYLIPKDPSSTAAATCCTAVCFSSIEHCKVAGEQLAISVMERVAGEICVYADCTTDLGRLLSRPFQADLTLILNACTCIVPADQLELLDKRVVAGLKDEYLGLPQRRVLLAKLSWACILRAIATDKMLRGEVDPRAAYYMVEAVKHMLGQSEGLLSPQIKTRPDELDCAAIDCVGITLSATVHLSLYCPDSPDIPVSSMVEMIAQISVQQIATMLGYFYYSCSQGGAIVGHESLQAIDLLRSLPELASGPQSIRCSTSLIEAIMDAGLTRLTALVDTDPLALVQVWSHFIGKACIHAVDDCSLSPTVACMVGQLISSLGTRLVTARAASELTHEATGKDKPQKGSNGADTALAGLLQAEAATQLNKDAETAASKLSILRIFAPNAMQSLGSASSFEETLYAMHAPICNSGVGVLPSEQIVSTTEPQAELRLICRGMCCIREAQLREKLVVGFTDLAMTNPHSRYLKSGPSASTVLLGALLLSAGEPETPAQLLSACIAGMCRSSRFARLNVADAASLRDTCHDIIDIALARDTTKADVAALWKSLSDARSSLGTIGAILQGLFVGIPSSDAAKIARCKRLGLRKLASAEQMAGRAVAAAFSSALLEAPAWTLRQHILRGDAGSALATQHRRKALGHLVAPYATATLSNPGDIIDGLSSQVKATDGDEQAQGPTITGEDLAAFVAATSGIELDLFDDDASGYDDESNGPRED